MGINMPLIQHSRKEKVAYNCDIIVEVNNQIEAYCLWAGITDPGYFLEQAAKRFFENDSSWQDYLNDLKIRELTEAVVES